MNFGPYTDSQLYEALETFKQIPQAQLATYKLRGYGIGTHNNQWGLLCLTHYPTVPLPPYISTQYGNVNVIRMLVSPSAPALAQLMSASNVQPGASYQGAFSCRSSDQPHQVFPAAVLACGSSSGSQSAPQYLFTCAHEFKRNQTHALFATNGSNDGTCIGRVVLNELNERNDVVKIEVHDDGAALWDGRMFGVGHYLRAPRVIQWQDLGSSLFFLSPEQGRAIPTQMLGLGVTILNNFKNVYLRDQILLKGAIKKGESGTVAFDAQNYPLAVASMSFPEDGWMNGYTVFSLIGNR